MRCTLMWRCSSKPLLVNSLSWTEGWLGCEGKGEVCLGGEHFYPGACCKLRLWHTWTEWQAVPTGGFHMCQKAASCDSMITRVAFFWSFSSLYRNEQWVTIVCQLHDNSCALLQRNSMSNHMHIQVEISLPSLHTHKTVGQWLALAPKQLPVLLHTHFIGWPSYYISKSTVHVHLQISLGLL